MSGLSLQLVGADWGIGVYILLIMLLKLRLQNLWHFFDCWIVIITTDHHLVTTDHHLVTTDQMEHTLLILVIDDEFCLSEIILYFLAK